MTRKIIILGAGCAGTMVANKLRQALGQHERSITVIDRDADRIYRPDLLFVPFGIYQASDVRRPRSEFLGEGIDLAIDRVRKVRPQEPESRDGERHLRLRQAGRQHGGRPCARGDRGDERGLAGGRL